MPVWLPIVDISEHQGRGNFALTKSRGVRGLILRAVHGTKVDARLPEHWEGARRSGYGENDIAFYEFCNPKRGTPKQCAEAFVAAVRNTTGTLDTALMLDVESYTNESPNAGTALSPAAYAAWLEEHINILRDHAAPARIFGYTNKSYWDSGVRSPKVAGMLHWIGARYPINSDAGYAKSPVPADVDLWDEWAFSKAQGPILPTGAPPWQAWQFSAGYNKMGPVYGFQSSDLDLNIMDASWWVQLTGNSFKPPPPLEDDMQVLLVQDSRSVWATDWLTTRKVSQATIDLLVFFKHTPTNPDGTPLILPIQDGLVDEILDRTQNRYSVSGGAAKYDIELQVPSVPGKAIGTALPR